MKSALLSKIAMCVCPPAVVATTAVTVPPVRHAVHRLTAPSNVERPKPRRTFTAAYDCTPSAVPLTKVGPMTNTVVAPAAEALPVAMAARTPSQEIGPPGSILPQIVPGPDYVPPPGVTGPGGGGGPGGGTGGEALPEVSTWAMTITGFGMVGLLLRRKSGITRPESA